MRKITDLKEGDLLTLAAASELLHVTKKLLYSWHSKALNEPNKYPRGFKIGGHLYFLKSDIVNHINRAFSQAS